MLRKPLSLLTILMLVIWLAACADQETEPAQDVETETEGTAAAEAAEVTIQPVGDEMKYATTEFSVEAGQEVTILFNNTASSPAMHHNVVVLQTRDAIERVGQAALTAGEANGYIPEDDAIIAHTAMSAPGETVEVTFTAPSTPGDYPYICTFPGHYVLMQGTMHVTGA